MAIGRKVGGAVRSLVNALHVAMLMPVLLYTKDNDMKKKKIFRIRAVHMDNLRGLLGIRRMYRVLNAWVIEFFGVTKGVDKILTKSFSQGTNILKEWRIIGLLRGK